MRIGIREPSVLLSQAESSERDGEWQAAEQIYSRLFQEAVQGRDAPLLTEVVRKQGRMCLFAGRPEEAGELVQLSAEVARRLDFPAAAARAINLLALIHHSQGSLDAARELYGEALERARAVRDDQLVGAVCQNLGVLANIRGDVREARVLYLECIAAMVRSGDKTFMMGAYNNLGMACADLMEWTEAEVFFARGIEIAEQIGDTPLRAKLYVNHAEPLIHFGELERAQRSLAAAEELAAQVDDACALSDVARYRGVIARRTGDHAEADRLLAEALSIAEGADLVLERGEAVEEIARLRWAEGRGGAAGSMLREARRCYQEVGAHRDVERIDRTAEEWRSDQRAAAETSTH